MSNNTIHNLVIQAVGQRWQDFADARPHLADILNEELIVEHVSDRLRDDPTYQQTMAHSAAVGQGTDALRKLIDQFVARFLRQLLSRR